MAEELLTVRPVGAARLTGLLPLPAASVCVSTMILPQCSAFTAAPDRVYQLRALNLEGEAMMQTFVLVP